MTVNDGGPVNVPSFTRFLEMVGDAEIEINPRLCILVSNLAGLYARLEVDLDKSQPGIITGSLILGDPEIVSNSTDLSAALAVDRDITLCASRKDLVRLCAKIGRTLDEFLDHHWIGNHVMLKNEEGSIV